MTKSIFSFLMSTSFLAGLATFTLSGNGAGSAVVSSAVFFFLSTIYEILKEVSKK